MSIRIGTAERDSTFLGQGLALKTVLERNPQLAPVEVWETAHASTGNANRLDAGEIDFGFMASNWIGRAKNGEAPFERNIDLRMVAPMNAGPLFFIARAEAPMRTVADLRDRRVAVGPRLSGMTQHAHAIFGALGLTFDDITPVYLDFADGAAALAVGAVDVQLQCPIPNKVMTELSERVAVRVLPYAAGDLDKVLAAVPFYRRTIIREGGFRGLDADVPQVAVVNVLVTRARVNDATVRAVTASILSARAELGALNPLFRDMGELFAPLATQGVVAIEFGGVALHPGALAAYREAGLIR
jgi:TRAP transporter TAXI family solute receptor